MNGAGAAGIAVSSLLIHYGYKNFIVCDTKGAIYKGRPEGMYPFKEKLAEITNKDCLKYADVNCVYKLEEDTVLGKYIDRIVIFNGNYLITDYRQVFTVNE